MSLGKAIIIYSLFVFAFQSCIVVNFAGKADEDQCQVHHKKMKRTVVRTWFGLSAYDAPTNFPNAKGPINVGCVVSPWPLKRFAIIYHCTVCDSIGRYYDKQK